MINFFFKFEIKFSKQNLTPQKANKNDKTR